MKDRAEIEKELRLINVIVDEAVSHGGDMGRSYFSNGEKLNDVIMEWINRRGLSDRYITDATIFGNYDGIPEISRIPDSGEIFCYLND